MKSSLLFLVFMLCLPIVSKASPALDKWTKCIEQKQTSPQANKIAETEGIIGLNEYLIDQCGFRPIIKKSSGSLTLEPSDCEQLYSSSKEGSCSEENRSVVESTFISQLNPTVFLDENYLAACPKVVKNSLNRKSFEQLVCTDCMQGAKIANQFINDYTQYNNDVFNQKNKDTASQWLEKNKLITDNFKKSYQQLLAKAGSDGLDFDPIFNAQDYPDKGLKIVDCSNVVTLAGKDKPWKNFKIRLKVINTKTGWLVDGAGVINMPNE